MSQLLVHRGRAVALSLALGCANQAASQPAALRPADGTDASERRASATRRERDPWTAIPRCDRQSSFARLWRFHAGAPLPAPPTPLPAGGFTFGTHEGYVHAVGPSGEFLWSYTLSGAVTGSVAVLPSSGDVAAATYNGNVYRLRADGSGLLRFRIPSPAVTGLVVTAGRIWYGAADQHLYALTGRGRIVLRLDAGSPITSGPVASGRSVLVATATGRLLAVEGLRSSRRTEMGSAIVEAPLVLESGRVYVQSGATVAALSPELELLWRGAGVQRVAATRSVVLTVSGTRLQWRASAGELLRELELPERITAAPIVLKDDALVVTESARLLALDATGCVAALTELPQAGYNWLHASGRRVLAAAGDGEIVALELGTSGG